MFIYTISLHDALPISSTPSSLSTRRPGSTASTGETSACRRRHPWAALVSTWPSSASSLSRKPDRRPLSHARSRSEEHTYELQSPCNLVCRLLHEKKKK